MINQIHLLGRIGKDVEVRSLDGGKTVASMTLATTEKYNGEEKTQWHNITLWNKQAELARDYVKKGDLIHIIGKMEYETYEVEGVKKTAAKVIARNMTFVQKGKNHDAMTKELSNPVDGITDDLPF